MKESITARARILRAKVRRWSVQRRRVVPRPVLVRVRAVGIVLVVIGIVAQSLSGWERGATASSAPQVRSVVGVEAIGSEVGVDVPAVGSDEVSLVVVTRSTGPDDTISAPDGWELLRRDDHPAVSFYQAVYVGASGADAGSTTWAFSVEAPTTIAHIIVTGAGTEPTASAAASTEDGLFAPVLTVPRDDSLVLDVVASTEGLPQPSGVATVHEANIDGVATMIAAGPADAGDLAETVYPNGAGLAATGVATRIVLAPAVSVPDGTTTVVTPDPDEPTPTTSTTTVDPTTTVDSTTTTTSTPEPAIEPTWDTSAKGVAPILEQNDGQFDEAVDFVVRGQDATLFLADGALVYDSRDGEDGQVVRMEIEGADPDVEPVATGLKDIVVNYFLGADPDDWVTDVEVARTAEYDDVVEGVDIRYLGTRDGLRYDLLLEPGVDPSSVAITFDGADAVRLGADGQLVVEVSVGEDLVFSAPVTYQDTPDGRIAIESSYVVGADGLVAFEVGEHDESLPLVIDPTLSMASYLGGSGADQGDAIGVDSSGNVIVAGRSTSTNYPTTAGAYDTTDNVGEDIVVSKLSEDGTTLLWSTYLGGGSTDAPLDLFVDGSDRPVVVGYTSSSDFPTTSAYDSTANGGVDAFAFRLSSTGASLDFSTYMGSVNDDYFAGVAEGPSGSVVIGGYTNGSGFPTTTGAYDRTHGGNDDGVVVRLGSAGNTLVYSTFIGGTTRDRIHGIAVGSSGTVHVAGDTQGSLTLPVGGYDTVHNGSTDALYAELSGTGASLLYATYFGAGVDESAYAVALGSDTDVFLVGETNSSSGFPTIAGSYDTSHGGSTDGWVAKLDRTQSGSSVLAWSTFYGGSGADGARGVELDDDGRVHVAMNTTSTGLATSDGWDSTLSGSADALIGVFSADGTQLSTASYVGGSGSEMTWDMVVDADNRSLIVGDTSSSDLSTPVSAYDRTLSGTWDIFAFRSTALPPANVVVVNSTGDAADTSAGNGICSTGGTNSAGAPTCTLRAAIQEANASASVDTIEFDIPTTETGYSAGRGVFTITATSSLPNITAPLSIDGDTQASNGGDTNPGTLGYSGTVGTGSDGVVDTGDELAIDGVPAPEVEIVLGGYQGFVVAADSVSISAIAVYGGNRDMAINSGSGTVIQDMVIGAMADSFADPGAATRSSGSAGVAVLGGSGAVISGNLIGYQALRGVEVSGTVSNLTISGNELRGTSQGTTTEGGGIEVITYWGDPGSAVSGLSISGNLIADMVDDYNLEIATVAADTGIVVEDNTITGNRPILVYGTQNSDGGVIEHNVIADSDGHGVQVSDVAGWTITQNSIANSTWLGIALFDANDAIAAPTIDTASSISGAASVGYSVTAPAGTYVVEFFDNSLASPSGYGEGETYLDSDSISHPGGTASYTHTVTALAGDILAATLTEDLGGGDLGSTSEFSNAFSVTQGALDPVILDDIQKGVRTLSTGSSSVTVEIDPVDPTKAFLQFSVRGSGNAPSDMSFTGQLTDSDTVTFARTGTSGDVVIDWTVVEFASGVTVQRGGGSAEDLTNDFPITSVDTTRSFPIVTHREVGNVYDGDDFVRGHLSSGTNLRVLGPGGGSGNYVEWQVVEYNDAAVTTGTVSLASGATSATATLPAFDTSQAWLLYTYSTESGTATDIGQKLVRGRVTNSTTLTFDRANTGTAIDVRYHLIEFTDSTQVQHGTANLASASSTADVTINAVDPARAISGGGYMYAGGSSSYAGDDVPGVGWGNSRISSSTNLRLTRASTVAAADMGWFVVHWGGTGPDTVTVNSTDDDADLYPGDGYCDTGGVNASGHTECTLRAAIAEANASAVIGTIDFDIPTSDSRHSGGVWTFTPGSAYPALSQSMTVDATTQTGYTTTPVISIDGAGITGGPGLDVSGAGVTVRGLNIRSVPGDGVYVSGSGFTLEDSHIGTNAAGTAASANTLTGLLIAGPDAVIQRNLISGNSSNGVRIETGGDRASFFDNFIGTTVTGNAALPNGQEGVEIDEADDVVVGEPGRGNVISGNLYSGINGWAGDATGTVIQGNLIGVGADGTTVLGNSASVSEGGIAIRGPMHDWVIGGTGPGEANVIAHNMGGGVQLVDVNGAADDIAIVGNAIVSNTGLGIDIDDDGVTANDVGDVDTGINDRLNLPVVSSVVSTAGSAEATFALDLPTGNYRVEFFANAAADASGYGEGLEFIHGDTISHAGLGSAGFTMTFPADVGDIVTATVTEDLGGGAFGSTSEFSAASTVLSTVVTVNSTGNTADASVGDGFCDTGGTNSAGDDECTLRAAVAEANASAVVDTIHFDIPTSDAGYTAGGTYWTISPTATLELTASVTVDATTQPGYASAPEILLLGTSAAGGSDGFTISGDDVTVRGFAIADFPAAGIYVTPTSDGAVIESNYIGTNITGTASSAHTYEGIYVDSATNLTIGGVGAGNVISGNASSGIGIDDAVGVDIIGNRIGTTPDGASALANAFGGIVLNGVDDVTVGGSGVGEGNLISGNTGDGIDTTWVSNALIEGNVIGLAVDEDTALANTQGGIDIGFGSTSTITGNVVSGNGSIGIATESDDVTITDNLIGTDGTGMLDRGNGSIGIHVGGGTNQVIGGVGMGNTISGNGSDGIQFSVASQLDAVVQGNRIGVGSDGTTTLANGLRGIAVFSSGGILIGGSGAGQGNTIANSASRGVVTNSTATDIALVGNSVYANSDIGFDLGLDGVTANDPGDGDSGSNDLLNFPVIVSATKEGSVVALDYALDAPAGTYRIEFFENPSGADPTGYGEGEAYVGADPISHPGGSASYSVDLIADVDDVITAVATEDLGSGSYGSSSEFSAAFTVTLSDVVTVNSTGNAADASAGDGICDTGGVNSEGEDECTLRAAIAEANASVVIDTVHFDIPAGEAGPDPGVWVIQPVAGGALPAVTASLTIDGTTQPGFTSEPVVAIDGTGDPFSADALHLDPGSDGSVIRGLNIRNFPDGDAIHLESGSNTIVGNYLGTDASGNDPAGIPGGACVYVTGGSGNVIGGMSAADRNVIGACFNGISISAEAADGGSIVGNHIGVGASGTADIGPDSAGIRIAGADDITITDNVIGNTPAQGINVVVTPSSGLVIQRNLIGLAADGVTSAPTGLHGIALGDGAFDNLIGSDDPNDGNVIANVASTLYDGVRVFDSAGSGNSIIGNSISGNGEPGGLGIDLGPANVTPNDAGDVDGGGNDLLNFPVIASAVVSVTVDVSYSLDVPAGNYRVEFFANPSGADATGYGEGELFVHAETISHAGFGPAGFTASFSGSAGDVITATVTEDLGGGGYGSTSEFSEALTADAPPVAAADADNIAEDGASTVDVLANDADADADSLSVDSVTQGSNGSVVNNGDGTVTYTPDADWNGIDTYDYVVSDGRGGTDTGTVTITVGAVNDQPLALDDVDAIAEDGTSTVDVLANDSDIEMDVLAVTAVTQGANGSVMDNGDGTVTYTSDADWSGTDTYTYTVSDGSLTDTATVTVTVAAVNDQPVAVDDGDSITEDGSSTVDVLANDSDVDGDSLSVTSVTQGANGSVVDNGDGTVTYTPDVDWNGVDTFTYTVSDGSLTDTATVTITVTAVNDPPVADADGDSIAEDGSSTVDVLDNDVDVDGDPLTVTAVTQPTSGTAVNNGDGTVTYTPDADFNGTDSYSYTVSDGTVTDNGTVVITVTAVNDTPVAVTGNVGLAEDGALVIDPIANDTDVDGDTLALTGFAQPGHGTVTDNGDGTVTYTPDLNWNGVDSFTYTVGDGTATAPGTVWVTVAAVNDQPVAADDTASTNEDSAVVVSPLSNDSDVDPDTLTVDSLTQPANGSVLDNGDGTVTYVPVADFNGVDTFTYVVTDGSLSDTATVTVTVGADNDPPVATDDADSISEDGSATIDLLSNDTDTENDPLVIAGVSQGTNGTVVDNGDGTATYTPDPDWHGSDSFTYTVSDGSLTDTATVTVVVNPVNDFPAAVDDAGSTGEDGSAVIDLLGNDTDVDGDIVFLLSVVQPANGSVVDNGDGTVTYTPDPQWNGSDTFSYTVSDGALTDSATVTVTVTAINDQPVATDDGDSIVEDTSSTVDVLANDSDTDGDTLAVATVTQGSHGSVVDNGDGTVTYTPDADWNGTDSYTYTVSDGSLTDTATVTITVTAANDQPVAVDDADSAGEDGSVVIDLLVNDSDADGDTLSVVSVAQGSNGTVVDNGDGTVTYTPDPDWSGVDTFSYTLTDGVLTDAATVTVTVGPVDDPPVAVDDGDSILEDGSSTIDVLANDTEVDGEALVITAVSQGANGTVVDNGDGTITYTPDADWNGSDTYTYSVSDGLTTDTATVTVTVAAVNDQPVAVDDVDSIAEDGTSTVDVLANDTDVENDTLAVTAVTQGANGTVVDNGDGTITYTPDADWNGSDTYTYSVSDGLTTDTATVTVTVAAVNDQPVAVDDVDSIAEDGTSTVDVLANDTDVENDTLAVTAVTQGANGTVVDNGDGTITYTPDADWNGSDVYTYSVSDGLTTDTATVTVTVAAVNDPPVAVDDTAGVSEDGSTVIDPLGNDTDADGDTLALASFGQGTNGTVVDNGDGSLTYTPDADWNGTDSFTYTVSDGPASEVATVWVVVSPINDPPVAANEGVATDEDTAVVISVLDNDSDVDLDSLSVDSLTQGAHGTVADNGDGTLTYTPGLDYVGMDTFTYVVTDGALTDSATVTVSVGGVNDQPVAVADVDSIVEDGSSTFDVIANDTDVDGDTLSVSSITQGSNGTVTNNGDGTVTYVPDPDWHGTDSYTYTVFDGVLTDTATVTVTVTAVNDQPVAAADAESTTEDTAVTVDVLGNDGDVDGDTLSVQTIVQPTNGVVTDNGDGTVTYVPDQDWHGSDSFTYFVSDGALTDSASVAVTVSSVNDDPVAVDDAVILDEDGVLVLTPLANDADVDGDALTTASITQPTNGSVVDNGDGTLTYTPDPDWNGTDSFSVTVTDGNGGSATSSSTITVTPVNDAPVPMADAEVLAEDTPTIIDVASNDYDVDGDPLVLTAASADSGGVVVVLGASTILYTPALDFTGTETISYTVSDGVTTSSGTLTVTLLPVNDNVIAVADAVSLDEDRAVTIDVLANDVDVDGDPLGIVSFTSTARATVSRVGQQIRFVPDQDANGVFTFTYTVSDGASASVGVVTATVAAVNDAPVAVDDTHSMLEDQAATFDVLANDVDVDGDRLRVDAIHSVTSGDVTITADGRVRVVPAGDFSGSISFRYTMSDGSATSTASVSVGVAAVNDAPSIQTAEFSIPNTAPVGTVIGRVSGRDPEGDDVTYSGVGDRITVSLDGTLVLMGRANVGETLSVLARAADTLGATSTAWATVEVVQGNRPPRVNDRSIEVASDFRDGEVIASMFATDPDGDDVTWSMKGGPGWNIGPDDGQVVKGELPGAGQTLAIPITATDPGGLSDTGLLTILVVAPDPDNRPPLARDDVFEIEEDDTVDLSVLGNDSDPDGDAVQILSTSAPGHGALFDDVDGVLAYKPDRDWFGTERLTYRISDGRGGVAEAEVVITVTPVNDPPSVLGLRAEVPAGQESLIELPPVTEPDGDSFTLSLTAPDRATVDIVDTEEGRRIAFMPSERFEGSTSFEVIAIDEFGNTGSAPVFVDVVVGKTSVSIDVLTGTDVPSGDGSVDETVRNVSPGGLALFMPLVGEALQAVWASRIPLFALLALLALSLFGSRRLHIRLGTKPLPLSDDSGRTWSVVLVQEGQTLPVFAGPDRSNEVVGRLHPLRCDLKGTGELSQTGGVIWVEIDADGRLGWVEASHVVANPRNPLQMSAVANALEQMVAAVRGEHGLEQWVSGRGLYVSHHAPPFRLTRTRVEGAMLDPTQFRWWKADGVQPELVGSFNEVVVGSVMDAMVATAAGELSTTPVPGEVLYEFTNFEQVALGTPETGWILCFERGLDNVPLLVGLMKRGALNPASLALESV